MRRILVEQSRDGISVLDQAGAVVEANEEFAHQLGYTLDEVYRLHIWDWDACHDKEQLLETLKAVGTEGDHFETSHRRKDGTLVDVEMSTNAAFLGGKKLVFCISATWRRSTSSISGIGTPAMPRSNCSR